MSEDSPVSFVPLDPWGEWHIQSWHLWSDHRYPGATSVRRQLRQTWDEAAGLSSDTVEQSVLAEVVLADILALDLKDKVERRRLPVPDGTAAVVSLFQVEDF